MIEQNKYLFRNLWQWFLIPLIVGSMTLNSIEGLSRLVVLYGFVFSFNFSIFYFLYYKQKVPVEVLVFFIWIVWSLGAWFYAVDQGRFWNCLKTVFQIGILLFLISGNIIVNKRISIVMFAISIGGIIVGLSSYIRGEFQTASVVEAQIRASGIADNANDFAYHLLFVIFATMYFWERKTSLWWRSFLSIIMIASVIGIVLSGSRKGFLGVFVFMIFWFIFCKSNKFFKKPIITIFTLLILITSFYLTFNRVMSSTYLGNRISYAIANRGSESRIQMYKEGLDMIKKYPLFGVGLDNYLKLSSFGMYSHSDYIEVAANTGIIGFLLYYSIYIILWRRFTYISARTTDSRLLNEIGMLKAALITILLVAFGRPNITSKLTWIFIGIAIGYSWSIKNALISKIRLEK